MSAFSIQPVTREQSPRYPLLESFGEEVLARHPFRSRASRPLAMAMAALGVGGLGAQGLSLGSSQSSSFMLEGRPAYPIGPTVMELIDPEAAEALIARVFAEEGYALRDQDVDVDESLRAEAWDPDRRVGFAILSDEDLPSDHAWAHFLAQTLGPNRHLASDPRDPLGEWEKPLPAEVDSEVAQLADHASAERVETSNGGNLLCLSPEDLTVSETRPWETRLPSTIEERAAALQRLEAQVREFILYLRNQGI